MSRRESVDVVVREDADPGVSPNRTVGQITVQIRVHYPTHAPWTDVRAVFVKTVFRAWRELRSR